MASPSHGPRPWYQRVWDRAKAFWQTENPKLAVVRDVAVAAAVVFILLMAVWGYTGQSFPREAPLVVVESGSMMHGPYRGGQRSDPTGWGDGPFGRIGTIDPGDLVFVKDVDVLTDIETAFGSGGRGGYGGHGDVIVFRPYGGDSTPIIHRAMLSVVVNEEGCEPGNGCVYKVPEACGSEFASFVSSMDSPASVAQLCQGTSQPISIVLERDGLELKLVDYPCTGDCGPFYSSFLTRGDNNPANDQNAQTGSACVGTRTDCNSSPVRLEWILGKARGELPWFGLIKLALYGNERYQVWTDPTHTTHWQILRAKAPWDLWSSLFITLGVVVAAPIVFDMVRHRLSSRDDEEERPAPEEDRPGRP